MPGEVGSIPFQVRPRGKGGHWARSKGCKRRLWPLWMSRPPLCRLGKATLFMK